MHLFRHPISSVVLTALILTPTGHAFAQVKSEEIASSTPENRVLLAQDQNAAFYEQAKADLGPDWYPVYRVTEKLIRSNGLDDQPWRIKIVEEYSMNAFATDINLIAVHAGLLDQIHGDASALACVIGHEMSHHTMRHIALGTSAKVEAAENVKKKIKSGRRNARIRQGIFNILSRSVMRRRGGSGVLGSTGRSSIFGGSGDNGAAREQRQVENAKESLAAISREHELEADEGGAIMVQRAGYDPSGCERIITLLARTPNGDLDTSHPSGTTRLQKMQEFLATLSPAQLKSEGTKNLSQASSPLTYEQSLDDESIRINSKYGSKGGWDF